MVRFIAHKGSLNGDNGLQNTLALIKDAVKVGVEIIELDVQPCKSGELILVHDPCLDDIRYIDLTFDQIKSKNPLITTLDKVMKWILLEDKLAANTSISNLKLYLDLKVYFWNRDEFAGYLSTFFNTYRKYLHRIILASFDHQFLSGLTSIFLLQRIDYLSNSNRSNNNIINGSSSSLNNDISEDPEDIEIEYSTPELAIILDNRLYDYDYLQIVKQIHNLKYVVQNYCYVDYTSICKAKDLGLEFWVYTINDRQMADQLVNGYHIDGIVTDKLFLFK